MLTFDQTIEELLADPPQLHFTADGPQSWSVGADVLRWLADNLESHWRTLETGCGYSSIVFMLSGAKHTIVAPYAPEHELARAWCEDRGFSTDRTTSIVDHSANALPKLADGPLDLGLIDGAHAFPMPFLDWYYIAERLRPGGVLLVDDIQLATCRLVHNFLCAELGRWEHVAVLGKTSMFRKVGGAVIPIEDWAGQPYVVAMSERPAGRLRSLRAFARPRTRIRRAIAGVRGNLRGS
jgi:hypothetical protein